jgi:TPR repeat protein
MKPNYTKSVQFYTKACNGKYVKGCSNLGFLYAKGLGVKKSYSKAIKLWDKACADGHETACKNYDILTNK